MNKWTSCPYLDVDVESSCTVQTDFEPFHLNKVTKITVPTSKFYFEKTKIEEQQTQNFEINRQWNFDLI